MDHIIQLKKIRAEAIARLRNSDDFKLAGKLGQLIVELGDTVDHVSLVDDLNSPTVIAEETISTKPQRSELPTFKSAFLPNRETEISDRKSDEMIDELVAEIEGDAANLDALMADATESDDQGEFIEGTEIDDVAGADKSAEPNGLSSLSSYFKSEKAEAQVPNGAAH